MNGRFKGLMALGAVGSLLVTQGCVATRDWVREQMDPVNARVTQGEERMTQAESQISGLTGRVSGIEGKLGQFDGRLGQVDEKAERALKAIANLRLERKLVIDMKEGANFAFNSANLPAEARREIDGFLSDLKGDAAGAEGTIFLVAGHTDSAGSEDYNYELGKRRAEAVSRYLITQKKVDPLRVIPVSYGESAPLFENNSPQNRAKNRRVEILVYREGINTATAPTPEQAPQSSRQQSGDQRFSQR